MARFRITFTDGTEGEIEADFWVKPQDDGPAWAHYHGNDERCDERCYVYEGKSPADYLAEWHRPSE
jgi:hypothetical protein